MFEFFDADPPEVIEFKIQTKTLFEQGVISYYSEQKERATQIFQRIINLNYQDKAAYFYLKDNEENREAKD